MSKRIHHFRDPGRTGNYAFCGAQIAKLSTGQQPVKPPANICPACDEKWMEYKRLNWAAYKDQAK